MSLSPTITALIIVIAWAMILTAFFTALWLL